MDVVKWIVLILIIGLAIYLTIDTIIFAVKRIKQRKAKKSQQLEQKEVSNDETKSS